MANDDFDRDDLFGDFDDDDSGGDLGDDLGGDDDFDFGEDEAFADLDMSEEDDDTDFEEDDFAETDSGSGDGPSRVFILLAAVLVIILLGGFGLIVYLVLGGGGPSSSQQTATAIVMTNNAVAILQAQTETQSAEFTFQTATADAFTDTPTPTATETATPTATEDTSSLLTQQVQGTVEAANALATATVVAMTEAFQTQLAGPPDIVSATPAPEITETGPESTDEVPTAGVSIQLSDVQMTATALSAILSTPTQEIATQVGTTPGAPSSTPAAGATPGGDFGTGGALPDTGVFDDIFSSSPLTVFAAVFGLLGVIVVSRRLRANNRKRD